MPSTAAVGPRTIAMLRRSTCCSVGGRTSGSSRSCITTRPFVIATRPKVLRHARPSAQEADSEFDVDFVKNQCGDSDIPCEPAGDPEDDGHERTKWKRVLLKVSGEALAGEDGFGIDSSVVKRVACEIAVAVYSGMQIAVVVGGGNFFRGADKEGEGLDRVSADHMGMLATVMNCISLQGALESIGIPTRLQTALEIREIAEPYIRRRAMRHLERKRVVIFGAGTGNPFFSTDSCAALRAAEINAQAVLKATNVDGVYDSDPRLNPDAKLLKEISFQDVMEKELSVMDATAITLCRENDIPIVVFSMSEEGNITKALKGESLGSIVSTDPSSRAVE